MKAVFIQAFGDRQVMEFGDLPMPILVEDQVLIRIMAAGVNPVDYKLRSGFLQHWIKKDFPLILGNDAAGIVAEVFSKNSAFQVGDAVFFTVPQVSGCYAEYIALPESCIALKPQQINFLDSAAVPAPALTAYQSIFKILKLKASDIFLINGAAGGVGSFAVQFAKYIGAQVVVVARKINHNYLKHLGADILLDYQEVNIFSEIKKYFPQGLDAILDLVGQEKFYHQVSEILSLKGQIVSAVPSHKIAELMHKKKISYRQVGTQANAEDLAWIAKHIDNGQIVLPEITVFPLARAAEALSQVEAGHQRGKLVLEVN